MFQLWIELVLEPEGLDPGHRWKGGELGVSGSGPGSLVSTLGLQHRCPMAVASRLTFSKVPPPSQHPKIFVPCRFLILCILCCSSEALDSCCHRPESPLPALEACFSLPQCTPSSALPGFLCHPGVGLPV